MSVDKSKKFATPQEEIAHWRELAQKFKQELEETKEEMEEFQISSRELESELEAQLEQEEKRNRELDASNSRLQAEVDSMKKKIEILQGSSHKRVAELEDELAEVRAIKEELSKYVRSLEQTNDDLERAKRATLVSLEDFEGRLNQAIERNAFLESELDEKETLMETIQRLKDEARDLRQEVQVKDVQQERKKSLQTGDSHSSNAEAASSLSPSEPAMADSGYAATQASTAPTTPATPTTPIGRGTPQRPLAAAMKRTPGSGSSTPLTPSARISALNIVGDLLRKVGALESKLASCRNFVRDQPRSGKGGATSPLNSPRPRRLNRNSTVPPPQGVKITV